MGRGVGLEVTKGESWEQQHDDDIAIVIVIIIIVVIVVVIVIVIIIVMGRVGSRSTMTNGGRGKRGA